MELSPAPGRHNPDKDSHHSSLLRVSQLGDASEVMDFVRENLYVFFGVNPSEHWAFLNHTGRDVATPEPYFPDDCKVSHSTLCNSGSTVLVRKCCYFFCCSSTLLILVLRQELLPQSVASLKQV